MRTYARMCLGGALGAWCLLAVGCAGPSVVSRGFDEHVNQFYVDSPLLAQLAWPIEVAGVAVTKTVDWCAVNPWYFWSDVFDGQGTPYEYHSPIAPPPAAEKPASGASGDEARGGTGGEDSGELLSISDPGVESSLYGVSASTSYGVPSTSTGRVTTSAQPVPVVAEAYDAPSPRAGPKSVRVKAEQTKTTASKSKASRRHTVKRGDTLSALALKYYGDGDKWQPIYQANRQSVRTPKGLRPGQVLVIPAKK